MKIARPPSDLVKRRLPAVLLAAQLGMLAAANVAQAQSAPDETEGSTFRSDRPANAMAGAEESGDEVDPAPDAEMTTLNIAEDAEQSLDTATLSDLGRQNPRETSVDGLRIRQMPTQDVTPGIALGSFTLRPELSEKLGMERTRTGKDDRTRSYFETGLKGSIVSDWSSHELRIDGEGTWQKTMSGIKEDDPEGRIGAALRLDVSNATTANLRAGFSLEREDIGDANAITNAATQSEVSTYTAGAEIVHDLGLVRGTIGVDFERETYGDARLANGTLISQKDRDESTATLRGRLGYELSPALIPFVEASYGQSIYDERRDSQGYIRDAELYAVKTGIAADFGEKLRGEISTGYSVADFEDARLDTLSAVTFDGNAIWSPHRGTDVILGLKTEIEPSTTAGASGSVAYTASAALTQAIIDELTGRLITSVTWRDYSQPSVANQTVYDVGAGVSWAISRSLDLTADVTWERTEQDRAPNSDVLTAGIGLALKR